MKKLDSVLSKDRGRIIDIVEKQPGLYGLQCYAKKDDAEEQCEYTIRVLPDPDGLFGELTIAIDEANRLIDL